MTDVDGIGRLDALNNFTALIHGHGFRPIVEAVTRQVARGSAFASSTPEEVALAELLCERVAGLERIRFGNSGTESVMMAIKAARLYGTGPEPPRLPVHADDGGGGRRDRGRAGPSPPRAPMTHRPAPGRRGASPPTHLLALAAPDVVKAFGGVRARDGHHEMLGPVGGGCTRRRCSRR